MRTLFLNIIVLFISLQGIGQTINLADSILKVGDKYEINNIRFGFDGERLPDESTQILDSIGSFLMKHPEIKIELGSHTDVRGKDEANLRLSQNRAEWMVNYLISIGVNKEQLSAKGYGESEPKVPEEEINKYKMTDKREFEKLHQQNRRNVLKILKIGLQE